ALPAVLGGELVLLLARDPRQVETLPHDLRVARRLLCLELRKIVPGRLPFLAGSDPVLAHMTSFCWPGRFRLLEWMLLGSRNHAGSEVNRSCEVPAARAVARDCRGSWSNTPRSPEVVYASVQTVSRR